MRFLLIAILLISHSYYGYTQTFLEDYKRYRFDKVDTLSNSNTRKRVKSFIKAHMVELDTVFRSYNDKSNFDFNTADTLFLIYEAPVESPFTNAIIIWSDKDTISYRQGFETGKRSKNKKIITYGPSVDKLGNHNGFKVLTEKDSLINLVSKRDFNTINHLGDNQNINDGSFVSIFVAYKSNGSYQIESCFPRRFIIPDTYRPE